MKITKTMLETEIDVRSIRPRAGMTFSSFCAEAASGPVAECAQEKEIHDIGSVDELLSYLPFKSEKREIALTMWEAEILVDAWEIVNGR